MRNSLRIANVTLRMIIYKLTKSYKYHIAIIIVIPSKLLQLVDRPLAGPSIFEGMIGTEICACFMASLR